MVDDLDAFISDKPENAAYTFGNPRRGFCPAVGLL